MLVRLHKAKLWTFVNMVEFWNILESKIVYKQLRPVKPLVHLQVWLFLIVWHEPPFLQGDAKQALIRYNS